MFDSWPGKATPPPRVPTDTVVPLCLFDDTIIFRTFVLYSLFVFDDVLDVQRLRDALERLVSRPGWNKLGARLRRNAQGKLEHHIPASFSEARPPITFAHLDHGDLALREHPIGSRIPKPTSGDYPAIVGDPDELFDFVLGPEVPKSLNDYLTTDRPQLGVRFLTFRNATVMVMHWMHLSFDSMAKNALLKAWLLMVQGKEDQIPVPVYVEDNPLGLLGTRPSEQHVLGHQHMKLGGLISWGLRNFYDLALSSKENRMVCIPPAYLERLRSEAMQEVIAKAHASGQKEMPFLSEGDILTAWFTRLAVSNYPEDSKTIVAVQQVFDHRKVIPDLLPQGRPYLGNCVSFLTAVTPAGDIIKKPLSFQAARIRQAILEQTSRKQVEAYASLVRADTANRAPPFFGQASMKLIMMTNWTKAALYSIDFSPATVNPRTQPLTASYIQNVQAPYKFNDGIFIVGKDAAGNYWISGYRAKGLWGKMEAQLAEAAASGK